MHITDDHPAVYFLGGEHGHPDHRDDDDNHLIDVPRLFEIRSALLSDFLHLLGEKEWCIMWDAYTKKPLLELHVPETQTVE